MPSAQANTNGSTGTPGTPGTPEVPGTSRPPGSPRCVLLIPARRQPDAELLVGLARRNVRVVVVDELPTVMFQLAAEPTHALIIAEPEHYAHLDELVDAVRTYHPQTRLWRYQPADGKRSESTLAQLNGYRQGAPAHAEPRTDAAEPPAAPPVDSNLATRGADTAQDEPHQPLISPEELAMLLGAPDTDDPTDAQPS